MKLEVIIGKIYWKILKKISDIETKEEIERYRDPQANT